MCAGDLRAPSSTKRGMELSLVVLLLVFGNCATADDEGGKEGGSRSEHHEEYPHPAMSASFLYVHSRFGNVPRTPLQESLDDFFITTMGIAVFLMQAGFAFLEAGSVRSKNTVNILMKNLLNFLIGGVVYWLVGFPLAFGDGNAILGWTYWPVNGMEKDDIVSCWYDFLHAITASSIAAGAVAGRCHRYAHAAFSILLTGVSYPIAKHWVWHYQGWLKATPYQAYAGAGIVHLLGGLTALVGTVLMGPRIGRFDEQTGKPTDEIKGHSVPFAALGGFILIFGFLAFAAGFQGHVSQPGDGWTITLAIVNSFLGGCGGGIGCLFLKRFSGNTGSWSFLMTLNGALAGIVSISAGANVYPPWASVMLGTLGGCLYLLVDTVMLKCKIDDPVGSISTHFPPVVLGLLAVGLIQDGGLFGDSAEENLEVLRWNCIGILAIGGWSIVTSAVVFGVLKFFNILRTPEYKEKGGLDYWNHGETAYPLVSWIEGEAPATHTASFVRQCSILLTTPKISAENLPAMVILDAVSEISDHEVAYGRPRASSTPAIPSSKFLEARRSDNADAGSRRSLSPVPHQVVSRSTTVPPNMTHHEARIDE